MPRLELLTSDSRLTIETRAKGLLAKLAHDLSIRAADLACEASIEGGQLTIALEARVAALEVDGVRKGNAVDRSVLSASDRADIKRKIVTEVLKSPEVVARVASAASDDLLTEGSRDLTTSITVAVGSQRTETRSRAAIEVTADRVRARGKAAIKLSSLRIEPVKGPLNAFRVDDEVEVVYDLAFSRPAP